MKKVSIIIPLYNLEKLIGKCIASALGQDLSPEEYEILVIDDGSTDGSLAAAEKAAQGHPNVHVYTKPNEGLSRTRNYGTDRAAVGTSCISTQTITSNRMSSAAWWKPWSAEGSTCCASK